VTQDLNTLLTALYVKIDDELEGVRWLGRPPKLTDSELICLAVAQVRLGFHSEARWLRFAREQLAGMFPYLPERPGYNKRLRAALPPTGRARRTSHADAADGGGHRRALWREPRAAGRARPRLSGGPPVQEARRSDAEIVPLKTRQKIVDTGESRYHP
jgi:hypothetical protein